MNDADIIRLLEARDETAMAEIESKYGRMMRAVALRVFSDAGIADECVNDALLRVWESIPPAKPDAVGSYACMIVRRCAVDAVRRERAAKRSPSVTEDFDAVCFELAAIGDMAGEVVDRIALSQCLDSFIGSLSRDNREIFVARYFDFEDVGSIASRLGVSENSVSTRLVRMRKALRRVLCKGGFFDE